MYYQYYLRTAERSYLAESSVFYDAVQQRKYFQELTSSASIDDWRRLLRYYARFIMVCLLQQHFDKVSSVSLDLHKWVQHYVSHLAPPDAQDWLAVVRELRVFCHACLPAASGCSIVPGDIAPPGGSGGGGVVLQQCVFVGCQMHQIKFSELTLDFLRMMRVVERRDVTADASPAGRASLTTSAAISLGNWSGASPAAAARNPTKHLMYRPSLAVLAAHLHGTAKELTGNGALLLFVTADAFLGSSVDPLWRAGAALGGSAAMSKEEAVVNALCPGDLLPLTRRPLLLICEGECAPHFGRMSSAFGAPFVALLAPEQYPQGMERQRPVVSPTYVLETGFGGTNDGTSDCFGNLFSLFLTDPVTAIARLCKVASAGWTPDKTARCREAVSDCLEHAVDALHRVAPWSAFCTDAFCSLFIAKFVLCVALLSRHKLVPRSPLYLPSSAPPLPAEAEPPTDLLATLFAEFGVESSFN